jgi:polyisoprenoid-binding protein YceI
MTETARTTRPTLTRGSWTALPSDTTAAFVAGNFRGDVHGTLALRSGRVEVDADGDPFLASAALDAASVLTGNKRRDKDLRGRGFLRAEDHPQVTWRCSDVVPTTTGWVCRGVLGVRGAETPLTLEVVVRSSGDRHLEVTATGAFDRRSLGIKAPAFMVGREVRVRIEAVLRAAD